MTNKYEPVKLHENAIRHKKANWQEQIREKRQFIEGKILLVIEWTSYQNKNIKKTYISAQRGKGDKMNLTRYEQEVGINLNAEEDTATVYTANPSWLRKMDVLAGEFPDIFRLIIKTEIIKTYEIPKRLVRIGKPREISPVQRSNLANMRNAKRMAQN